MKVVVIGNDTHVLKRNEKFAWYNPGNKDCTVSKCKYVDQAKYTVKAGEMEKATVDDDAPASETVYDPGDCRIKGDPKIKIGTR